MAESIVLATPLTPKRAVTSSTCSTLRFRQSGASRAGSDAVAQPPTGKAVEGQPGDLRQAVLESPPTQSQTPTRFATPPGLGWLITAFTGHADERTCEPSGFCPRGRMACGSKHRVLPQSKIRTLRSEGPPVGYTPEAWADFGGAVAAVAGALTGLLFVALSVKGAALSASLMLRSRAAQTLALFMTSVVIAVVLTAPQSSTAMGVELIALAAICAAGLLTLDRRAGHTSEPGVSRFVERFSPNTITAVLVAVSGVTLLIGAGGGLYWLIPSVIASLVGGVVNTWLFFINLPADSPTQPR